MVYEDVWLARAGNAARTRIIAIIARLDGLPTPPVIARADLDAAFASKLQKALTTFVPKAATGTLYAGFADYQDALMRRFFADLERVPELAAPQQPR